MEKICTKCKVKKNITEFYKSSGCKFGVRGKCKKCKDEIDKNRSHTKNGLIQSIFNRQNQITKRKKYKKVNHTKKELTIWLYSQPLFHELFDNWVKSGYKKDLIPSCDRTDDYQGYSLDRLQLMTWGENDKKGKLDKKNGINRKQLKAIIGINIKTGKIKKYYSASKASRELNIEQSNIRGCCKKRKYYKTAGGYRWYYDSIKYCFR